MLSFIIFLFWIAVILFIVIAITAIYKYNSIQGYVHDVKEAQSNLIGLMNKRVEVINKLIDIVQCYSDHEKLSHISIAEIESNRFHGNSTNSQIDQIMIRSDALSKQYPNLKADKTYLSLMADVKEIEGELQLKRELYNRCAKHYNLNRCSFPLFLLADRIGLRAAPYFDVQSIEEIKSAKEFDNTDSEVLGGQLQYLGTKFAESSKQLAGKAGHLSKEIISKGKNKMANRPEPENTETIIDETNKGDRDPSN